MQIILCILKSRYHVRWTRVELRTGSCVVTWVVVSEARQRQNIWVFKLFTPPSSWLFCLRLFFTTRPLPIFSPPLVLSPSLTLTFIQSLQSYWPWFLLICIHHFSFFGIWRWGTFPSLSEFTAISLCVFSKGSGYEMHIKYPLIPHYPTDKITMIMRQKF